MGLPSCTSAVWRRAYRESVALGAAVCWLLRREKAGAKEEEGKTGAECHHFRPGKPEVPVRTLPVGVGGTLFVCPRAPLGTQWFLSFCH